MTLKFNELKQLSFELFGAMNVDTKTNEATIITEGVLRQQLDLKSKYFLNKFAKQLTEILPTPEEETEELMNTDYNIEDLIKNFPPDLAEKVGEIKTKETYPILFYILYK